MKIFDKWQDNKTDATMENKSVSTPEDGELKELQFKGIKEDRVIGNTHLMSR